MIDEFVYEPRIAYFSMEIALRSEIATYAGGLGILAGDTVRSAADLGLPLLDTDLAENTATRPCSAWSCCDVTLTRRRTCSRASRAMTFRWCALPVRQAAEHRAAAVLRPGRRSQRVAAVHEGCDQQKCIVP
jgi:hypothetical protein